MGPSLRNIFLIASGGKCILLFLLLLTAWSGVDGRINTPEQSSASFTPLGLNPTVSGMLLKELHMCLIYGSGKIQNLKYFCFTKFSSIYFQYMGKGRIVLVLFMKIMYCLGQ